VTNQISESAIFILSGVGGFFREERLGSFLSVLSGNPRSSTKTSQRISVVCD
jgi:hypothetical protein